MLVADESVCKTANMGVSCDSSDRFLTVPAVRTPYFLWHHHPRLSLLFHAEIPSKRLSALCSLRTRLPFRLHHDAATNAVLASSGSGIPLDRACEATFDAVVMMLAERFGEGRAVELVEEWLTEYQGLVGQGAFGIPTDKGGQLL